MKMRMKVRGSYIWAFLIATSVIGWMVSDDLFSGEAQNAAASIQAEETIEASNDETESPVSKLTIRALSVTNETVPLQIRASGVTSTAFDVSVTSRRRAIVTAITASEGSWVKAGDVILELDKGTIEAEIAAARADRQAALASYEDVKRRFGATGTLASQLSAAEAELNAVQKNFDTTKKLVERGLQTELTLSNQRAQLRAAETRLFELQSQSEDKEVSASYAVLKTIDARLAALAEQADFTTITAPQDAWLEEIFVEIGELAPENGPVAHLLGLQDLIVTVPVPQMRISDIAIGNQVDVTISGKGDFTGKIHKIAATANQATRTFDVEVLLENKSGSLRAGMSAEASINIDDVKAFRISPAHLNVDGNGQLTAKIVSSDETVSIIPVTLVRTDGNLAYISGLADGDIILADGQAFLSEGEAVRYKIEEAN